jgi:hypothetical protein
MRLLDAFRPLNHIDFLLSMIDTRDHQVFIDKIKAQGLI